MNDNDSIFFKDICFNNITKVNILKKNGIIVMHRNKKSKDNYPNNFKILDTRKYGISKIIFGNLVF